MSSRAASVLAAIAGLLASDLRVTSTSIERKLEDSVAEFVPPEQDCEWAELQERSSAAIRKLVLEAEDLPDSCFGALSYEASRRGMREIETASTNALADKGWMRPLYASYSLGVLETKSAAGQLRKLSETHWYPGVRASAKDAAAAMDDRAQHPKPTDFRTRWYVEFAYRDIASFCAGNSTQFSPGSLMSANVGLSNKFADRFDQPVADAMEINGGVLVGTNMGEWGGGLYWLPEREDPIKLVDDNIKLIASVEGRILVVSGLSHLGLSRGAIYQIVEGPKPKVVRLLVLPTEPISMEKSKSDHLLVNTDDGALYDLSDIERPALLGCRTGAVARVERSETPGSLLAQP